MVAAFSQPPVTASQRLALLAGTAGNGKAPTGAMICSCFAIGEIAIADAVRQGCHSVQQLGAQLKCGTNCGSCIPELKKIIAGQLTSLTAGDDQ